MAYKSQFWQIPDFGKQKFQNILWFMHIIGQKGLKKVMIFRPKSLYAPVVQPGVNVTLPHSCLEAAVEARGGEGGGRWTSHVGPHQDSTGCCKQ